jgi:hypothetical protein
MSDTACSVSFSQTPSLFFVRSLLRGQDPGRAVKLFLFVRADGISKEWEEEAAVVATTTTTTGRSRMSIFPSFLALKVFKKNA